MDFWKLLSLATAFGVFWLVVQKRKDAETAATVAKVDTTKPLSMEAQVAAILAADA